MAFASVVDLADCDQFRQTLEGRPPRIVHGAVTLIVALLAAAVTWAALTKADLVVRAGGRIRPLTAPQKVLATFRGEVLTGGAGALVREVHFTEGSYVNKGDVLLCLDTERLDNEIERMQRQITSGQEELRKNVEMAALVKQQFEATRSKATAEIAQAEEEIRLANQRRQSDRRAAEAAVRQAEDEETLSRRLVTRKLVARVDWDKAVLKLIESREKATQAALPVEQGKLVVLRRTLNGLPEDLRIKLSELQLKQQNKQAEIDATRLQLANLELEHRQAVIRAPLSGIVTAGDIKPGETLEPGKPVVEIAEKKGFRFEVAVPAAEMEQVQTEMPVRIRLDAYDYQRYGTIEGEVRYVSADSMVNHEDESVVYLIKVDVPAEEIGRGDVRGPIKLGLTGQAEIVTGRESLLSILVRKIRRTISLG